MIFALSLALALLKAAQSGLFLEAYDRSAIPWAFALSAVTLASVSSLCVSLTPRLGPGRLALASLALTIAALVGLRLALVLPAPAIRFATYVVIEAASGVLVIQVWSTAAVACDARSARRLLPVAGLGAGAAWTLGGFLVPPLARALGAEALLVAAPVVLLGTLLLVREVVRRDFEPGARRGRRQSLVAAWRDGFAFVRREPLMRLVAGLAVLALLTEQFMDFALMATARETLEGAEAISAFYGRYYGATSALGMLLLAGVSGRLLGALGAARSLLVMPLAVAAAATLALVTPSLITVVVMRGVGRVLKQAVWSSSADQLQTPLSSVRRSQAKAAIRGVLAPGFYAVSAVGLGCVPSSFDTRWLAAFVLASSAAMALLALTRARRVYHRALHKAIDARRVLLGPGRAPKAADLDADACRALAEELEDRDPARAAAAAEVLGLSDAKQAAEVLAGGLAHEDASVRLAALRGLARHAPADLGRRLAGRLAAEEDATVRRAIVEVLRGLPELDPQAAAALEVGEADADPAFARACKVAGLERAHAGEALGEALLPMLAERASLADALGALTGEATRARGVQTQLAWWLEKGDPEAQLAVAATVVRLRLLALLPDVVRLLKDPRTAPTAARHLVALDEQGLDDTPEVGERTLGASLSRLASRVARAPSGPVTEALVLRLLQHPDDVIRRRAAEALGASVRAGRRPPLGPEVVEPLLLRDAERAYRLYSILAGLAHDDGVPDWEVEEDFAFLAHEVDLHIERARRDVLALLLLMGRQRLVDAVEVGRRRRSSARDAQVTELLELGLERELARRVVPLFERLSLRERVEAAERLELLDREALADPLDAIVALGDAHLRRCALLTYGERFEARFPAASRVGGAAGDAEMVPVYERMRFLRSVPLFRDLSGDDVLQLAEKVEQVEPRAGDTVFAKGDPGEDLYLVVRGRVAMVDGDVELASMGEREFFGELALLDHQPRSADAVCREDCTLLRLRGADLEELMARRPGATREIVRVLAHRLRETGRRIAE
ncbi:MAG TPA: cyclic nucleotide-binding domain-containing protein [Polyangiaceae bacterium LLY-WYZ-15_(1-7)]|nr:cyclic nucleotide-binding domain-containing protein [Polyangiaceae bacterium LLY-WYZ-15_(1-7)]HJL11344.1 cyclic nucleotide-binding domain-containing protein [Polyangiaceae bacterium LLY-WYZ-15_(1-7)]HJL34242.1 cyclic nucleotide-binding domain-containing protein [Polyangiaceae bacterium LLY-WYZ-15_(1-7)]